MELTKIPFAYEAEYTLGQNRSPCLVQCQPVSSRPCSQPSFCELCTKGHSGCSSRRTYVDFQKKDSDSKPSSPQSNVCRQSSIEANRHPIRHSRSNNLTNSMSLTDFVVC